MSWLPANGLEFWHWWAIAGLCLIPEMMAPGVVFGFLAIGALAAGLFALALPGAGLNGQLLVFALASGAAFFGLRSWLKQWLQGRGRENLNDRGNALVGQVLTLSEPILDGAARVRIGDSSWSIAGPDMVKGARVTIVAVEGNTLRVKPAS